MKTKILFLFVVFSYFTFFSCKKYYQEDNKVDCSVFDSIVESGVVSYLVSQDFETASDISYEAESVFFGSQEWYFDDALIGSTKSDHVIDSKSARIRNSGSIQMKFDVENAEYLSFYYAVYGTDDNSDFDIQYSIDKGENWTSFGTCIASTTSMQRVCYKVPVSGFIRFRILKTSGEGSRINIDNFIVIAATANSYDTTLATEDDNLAMGNPSNAVANTSYTTNYLMVKDQYALSYNNETSCPNWVSWHLSSAWLGDTPRYTGKFYADPTLPTGWYVVTHDNYTNTGFDRGHMCPSADRTKTYEDNKATFMTTNIVPQAPYNNQRAWKYLEDYCRDLADAGYEMYIIAGSYGSGGTGSNGYKTTIADGMINVPQAVWKVILVLPNGINDVNRVDTNTTVIAVYMPNEDLGTNPWTDYKTTVDFIEEKTGYNIFSNVPENIQSVIEAQVFDGEL